MGWARPRSLTVLDAGREATAAAKSPERAGKPNSVPGQGFEGPFDPPSPRPGPRSFLWARSRLRAQAADPETSRYEAGWDGRPPFPYLALLRMGFTVPPRLPSGRCALTAPFHPCRPIPERKRKAVCSLWHFPSRRRDRGLPGMLPVWSSDFPPRLLGAIAWPARSRCGLYQ
jgi:hypothetical protein